MQISFLLALAIFGITMPAYLLGAAVTTGFLYTSQQLAGNGEMGFGGTGGEGGKGGNGGFVVNYQVYPAITFSTQGSRGGNGVAGGKGGSGGSGSWIISNMASGDAFTNLGQVLVGGGDGATGQQGTNGSAGGKGGDGGPVYKGGHAGEEPDPDLWLGSQQGGHGGAYYRSGADGVNGGGGGGAGDQGIFGGGRGGHGGKGIDGLKGAGGLGTVGLDEVALLTARYTNHASIQIGGNGGQGGQGGQSGSGGGGGGGHGSFTYAFVVWDPEEGERGGNAGSRGAGGSGGGGGKGAIDVRYNGRFINETGGLVVIGRGSSGGEGDVKVRPGGELINSSGIAVSDNGKLEILGGKLSNNVGGTISSRGTIENNGIFVNNGWVETSAGEFLNYGVFKGTGIYAGDFNNNGVVAPGNSIGEMTIDGNFFNEGMLEIEIGGFDSGMYDFMEITGTASFSEYSMISFLSWNDYDFSDILPQESKSLEFLYADGGILDSYVATAFDHDFLPAGFNYDVLNDGHSLFLEVSNNSVIPLPSAIWFFGSGLLGLVGMARRKKAT